MQNAVMPYTFEIGIIFHSKHCCPTLSHSAAFDCLVVVLLRLRDNTKILHALHTWGVCLYLLMRHAIGQLQLFVSVVTPHMCV